MHCLILTSHSTLFSDYAYYADWLEGFKSHPAIRADIIDLQSFQTLRRRFFLRRRYDLIAFMHATHQSLAGSPKRLAFVRWLLAGVRGPRVFFLNNEYRALKPKCDMAATLKADFLVSQLCAEDAHLLYKDLWDGQLLSLPYGFDPQTFKPTTPHDQRSIHIGFRGDYYPAYVGHDDRDLLLDDLSRRLQKDHPATKADIQVGQRLERVEWAAYLNQCRALVGHEAGSARVDSDENIRHFLNAQYVRLTAEKYRQLVLTLREVGVFQGPPSGRIAAPRNFEAMGTKTVQVLLPGRYNDLLRPQEHYLELARDFSNLPAIVEFLADPAACQAMADRIYTEALAEHTYEKRIDTLLKRVCG